MGTDSAFHTTHPADPRIGSAQRLLDVLISLPALVLAGPFIVVAALLVWSYDRQWPFYAGERIGRGGRPFRMLKLRTMVVNSVPIDSTAADDPRITPIGAWLRRWKLDELPQFVNVLRGDLSLVGPRPPVRREVDVMTPEVRNVLLSGRPGMTDPSSIVFANEGELLKGAKDPDGAYFSKLYPIKVQLSSFYIKKRTAYSDLAILAITFIAIWSHDRARSLLARLFQTMGASTDLVGCIRQPFAT